MEAGLGHPHTSTTNHISIQNNNLLLKTGQILRVIHYKNRCALSHIMASGDLDVKEEELLVLLKVFVPAANCSDCCSSCCCSGSSASPGAVAESNIMFGDTYFNLAMSRMLL